MKKTLFYLVFTLISVMTFNNLLGQDSPGMYFTFLNTNPDKPIISEEKQQDIQDAHLLNLETMADQGTLLAAGPFDGGGGMLLLQAGNIDDAKGLVLADPAVKANRFNTETYPFMIAGNDYCGAKKPYEMVTYQFVRFISNVEYFGDMDKMNMENRMFLGELNNFNDYVIVYGGWGEYNDGILIIDVATTEEAEKIVAKHPAVKAGQLKYEVKQLWIAKGTFCKK
jgi:uncharacterized protein YciI